MDYKNKLPIGTSITLFDFDVEDAIHSLKNSLFDIEYKKICGEIKSYRVKAHSYDRKPWEISLEDEFGNRKGFKSDRILSICRIN